MRLPTSTRPPAAGAQRAARPQSTAITVSSSVLQAQPGTASQSPPRPGPPRYLLPRYPPALGPGFASPNLGHVPLPHTRRPTPSASPREKRPGARGRGKRSARLLTSGWRRGTQPASASYSSGPSAILVLNPSARCMPGESVHPRGARVRRRASGWASASASPSPAGGDATASLSGPCPPDAPSAPAPRRARVPARAREPGRPSGSALCCTARGGGRADGSGRGLRGWGRAPARGGGAPPVAGRRRLEGN